MNITAFNNQCLAAMGITQWELRSTSAPISEPNLGEYYLFVDSNEMDNATLSSEKLQLIDRMLLALRWPSNATRIEFLTKDNLVKELFFQDLNLKQPKKILLFSTVLGNTLQLDTTKPQLLTLQEKRVPIAVLPTLTELLTIPSAKKQAWQLMQSLIN